MNAENLDNNEEAVENTASLHKKGNLKKKALISSIFIAGLILLFSTSSIFNIDQWKRYLSKSKTAEAKVNLEKIYNAYQYYLVHHDGYPTSIKESRVELGKDIKYYKFGFAHTSAEFKQACPDCVLTKDKFKIAAIGNIDEDSDVDIWTIDQDKKLIHFKSDI